MVIRLYVITIVFNHEHKAFTEFPPGRCDHVSSHRSHSLLDFFLEVVYVIDSSLVDPVFDIAPQEKITGCDIWGPGRLRCWSSATNPVVGEGVI